MNKKTLTLTFLLLLHLPLSAMDLNETKSIINEASKATKTLQNKFDTLINEKPFKEEVIEVNGSTPLVINTKEVNKSIDINTTTLINCNENNESVKSKQCIDTPIEGKSIRGLIIFKTRIKPLCEINGEAFAKQYIQEDWDDIYYEKEFKMEVIKACPKIEKKYKDTWTPHLYQFTLEYASDSDAIPEC